VLKINIIHLISKLYNSIVNKYLVFADFVWEKERQKGSRQSLHLMHKPGANSIEDVRNDTFIQTVFGDFCSGF
jgi:hypothetical protein